MYPRVRILKDFLCEDGAIFISIDDDEGHYLKALCDEIFGRQNFISNIIWQKKHTRANDAKWFSDNHDHIIAFAKNKELWVLNKLPRTEEKNKGYTNPDNDPRGVWASGPCHVKTPNEKDIYPILTPSGRSIMPPAGTSWRFSLKKMGQLIKDNKIYFGKTGNNVPRYKRFLTEVQDGIVPLTIWNKDEVGDNQEAKKEVKQFNSIDIFATPKPERLLERIIHLSSNKNDIILDSFAGSGTTGAVAQKMGRKSIMIEMGEHAQTHIVPRLKKIASGEDQGGISKEVEWKGGGGTRFCKLGKTLFDEYGNINPEVKFNELAAHVYFCETGEPLPKRTNGKTPLLGINNGTAIYLLYNGILGDKAPNGGNVLTREVLNGLPNHDGAKIVFGTSCRLGNARLQQENIIFKQIPYEVNNK